VKINVTLGKRDQYIRKMASKAGRALFGLESKVALVTGASAGLGRAMATALAGVGCEVILAARRVDKIQEACEQINRATKNSKLSHFQVDLMTDEGVNNLAKYCLSLDRSPDILINAAGVNLRQPEVDITSESWDTTLHLNLKVPFFLARQLAPKMKERKWGKIVNIASLQSERAFPNSISYGASKGGVSQLTRAMAEEWSRGGINVNAIGPGFFPTELTASVFEDKEKVQKLADQTCIKRNGTMEDVHGVAIFLCSHASDYITGQTIFCDGGFTAK
jgi:NAD(P)-dependent dehydrogenase (short-subunit alcohol dehydrogenase family)